jgi:predicted phage-related endonuclease
MAAGEIIGIYYVSSHASHVLVETTNLSSTEWLLYRRKGIGGSDVAAICGISKWKRPIHVYLDKIGDLPESELGEPAEWGTRLESLIADKFASEHPEWAVTKKDMIYSHPRYERALGNIDRMLYDFIIHKKNHQRILSPMAQVIANYFTLQKYDCLWSQ